MIPDDTLPHRPAVITGCIRPGRLMLTAPRGNRLPASLVIHVHAILSINTHHPIVPEIIVRRVLPAWDAITNVCVTPPNFRTHLPIVLMISAAAAARTAAVIIIKAALTRARLIVRIPMSAAVLTAVRKRFQSVLPNAASATPIIAATGQAFLRRTVVKNILMIAAANAKKPMAIIAITVRITKRIWAVKSIGLTVRPNARPAKLACPTAVRDIR